MAVSHIRDVCGFWYTMMVRDISISRREPQMFAIDLVDAGMQCATVYTNPFNTDLAAWHLEVLGLKERAVSAEEKVVGIDRRKLAPKRKVV